MLGLVGKRRRRLSIRREGAASRVRLGGIVPCGHEGLRRHTVSSRMSMSQLGGSAFCGHKIENELTRQPGGREAEARWVELARKCVGSIGCTRGSAEPEQAQGEALLESTQYEGSDGSVHAPSVDTGVTREAYSTGSLTMGVGCTLEHQADSGSAGARHVLTARAEASNHCQHSNTLRKIGGQPMAFVHHTVRTTCRCL